MNKFFSKQIKIQEIISNYKILDFNLPYQRNDDAWSKKNKNKFIDSILNNYLIPPIIINKNENSLWEVLDGKQRLTTIWKFYNGDFDYIDENGKTYKYNEVENNFLKKELIFIFLENENSDKLHETFLRINKGSINLNKNEFIFSNMNETVKSWFKDISNTLDFKNICNKKTSDKRFSWESYNVWTLTIILNNNQNIKTSVRQLMEKSFTKNIFLNNDLNKETLTKNYRKVFQLIKHFQEINENIIPNSSFKTIYTSLFVALYRNIDNYNIIFSNKEKIVEELLPQINEITKDQMGGGTKFDGLKHIEKRINTVNQILTKYLNDSKRSFDINQKNKIIEKQNWLCSMCNTKINISNSHGDHIIPYSHGGKTNIDNLQMLCPNCNFKKSNKY